MSSGEGCWTRPGIVVKTVDGEMHAEWTYLQQQIMVYVAMQVNFAEYIITSAKY
jgi:hypothetical protein